MKTEQRLPHYGDSECPECDTGEVEVLAYHPSPLMDDGPPNVATCSKCGARWRVEHDGDEGSDGRLQVTWNAVERLVKEAQ